YFQFTKEHLQEYLPRVLTNQKVEGVKYTYGNRLRNWRGIDQIESLIKRLKESLHTRRAVAVTWDVEKDHCDSEAPCLDLIQCLVQNNVLYLTAFFRSNDMFAAWPENALALRKLQGLISAELGTVLGSLTTLSGSAHVYQGSWSKAADILSKNKIKIEQLNDPRGNFVIYLSHNQITVEHQSPEGKVLEKITGKTAQELSCQLVQKQKISDYYHALYLGRELQKAELALQNNLNYEQEQSLMQEKAQKKGKFIVIDGLDGSGKGTQTRMLVDRLNKEGHEVEMVDFPQYGNWSAHFVERYLRGEFGSAAEVSAKKASLFYALDRYAASFKIKQKLAEGKMIISNRYVSANKGHQLGKIGDQQEWPDFLDWINQTEYSILNIPVPDLTLFLHMKPEIGQKLVDQKAAREYTHGQKRDLHEADLSHLQNAEKAFLFCLKNDKVENWHRLICFNNDQPKTIDEIHQEIYRKVKEMI
ncbi:MAG TPA: thymidylate synthase, partial [Candidatus Nanoarchaeia archaeon]|nr:thymidylate synthase [Candidatus Nanoarchaeia archaeon]